MRIPIVLPHLFHSVVTNFQPLAILVGIFWIYPQSEDRKENIVDVETVKAQWPCVFLTLPAIVSFAKRKYDKKTRKAFHVKPA